MNLDIGELEAAAEIAVVRTVLEDALFRVDKLGLSMAAIHLDHAIALLGEADKVEAGSVFRATVVR